MMQLSTRGRLDPAELLGRVRLIGSMPLYRSVTGRSCRMKDNAIDSNGMSCMAHGTRYSKALTHVVAVCTCSKVVTECNRIRDIIHVKHENIANGRAVIKICKKRTTRGQCPTNCHRPTLLCGVLYMERLKAMDQTQKKREESNCDAN